MCTPQEWTKPLEEDVERLTGELAAKSTELAELQAKLVANADVSWGQLEVRLAR